MMVAQTNSGSRLVETLANVRRWGVPKEGSLACPKLRGSMKAGRWVEMMAVLLANHLQMDALKEYYLGQH